ncbi:tripartite motif-containing protein 2 [Patella vulgata]|uniref:tripartite motif-containing protein 2 n=1 Tax=Patella vulgata TaxID=6465 RepID=UPI00217F76E9|nr:tripartite motif-containing protein 2 [Patella vulgata]
MMASNNQRSVCSICLNSFHEPKILPCFHTFCLACLEDYILRIVTNKDSKEMPCPLCRSRITIPKNGAKGFCHNFYVADDLEIDSVEDEQFVAGRPFVSGFVNSHPIPKNCDYHKITETTKDSAEIPTEDICHNHSSIKRVSFYCTACNQAVCSTCLQNEHSEHAFYNLAEDSAIIRRELGEEIKKMDDEIPKLGRYYKSLNSQMSDVINSIKQTCKKIDQQVENICIKVRRHGEELKYTAQSILREEQMKTDKIKEDIAKLSDDLRICRVKAASVLEMNSVVQLADVLTKTREKIHTIVKTAKECTSYNGRCVDFQVPNFVNDIYLSEMLGQLQIVDGPNFRVSFHLEQVTSEYCWSENRYIRDLPWYVGVRKYEEERMGIYLKLNKTAKRCNPFSGHYTIKLINHKDDNLSVTKKSIPDYDYIFIPGGKGWGWNSFIDWQKLSDPTSGFLDGENKFSIQIMVKITNQLNGETELFHGDNNTCC